MIKVHDNKLDEKSTIHIEDLHPDTDFLQKFYPDPYFETFICSSDMLVYKYIYGQPIIF